MKTKPRNNPSLSSAAGHTAARFVVIMAVMVALLGWGLVLNVNTGSMKIPASQVLQLVWRGFAAWIHDVFTGDNTVVQVIEESTQSRIIFSIRMPRMLLASILGGALALSGFLLQTFFRNPIAGPFVLGISSGAKMVVGITMIFMAPVLGKMNAATMVFAAFLGSLLITSLVLLCAQRVRSMSMLLVVGIMVSYICSAITDFSITFASEHDVVNLTHWSMGAFSGASWRDICTAAIFSFAGLLASLCLSKPMGAYALGEGYALSLGIPIKAVRTGIVLVSSMLSACVTALAGPISFVGIAVPHIARSLLRSSKPIYVIPCSFLCGSVFCLFCDLIARTVFAPTELAIGTVTSVFGAPVVIFMLLRRKQEEA